MIISSGTKKGQKIKAPPGIKTRPTSSKVRQALFNILGLIEGKIFLDMYAGSGAVGLEALARGAKKVIFVESNKEAVETIKANIMRLGFQTRSKLIPGDLTRVFNIIPFNMCDIIFADPPYGTGEVRALLNRLAIANISNDTVIIIQHEKKEKILFLPMKFAITKEYYYGNTVLSLIRHVLC